MNKIRRITVLRSLLLDFFFDLRLAIVLPPAIQAIKSGLDPLCLVRPARARTTTTSRAANMQSEPLHCRPIQLAVSPDDAYKPRKTGLCKNQVTLKLPCTSIFGVDGRKISLVIYSAMAFFSTSGGDFSAS